MLFTGTIRSNVDPLQQGGGDGKVWEALEQAGLGPTVRELQVSSLPWPWLVVSTSCSDGLHTRRPHTGEQTEGAARSERPWSRLAWPQCAHA